MASFTRITDINAWQEARTLAKSIYQLTSQGELARDFGLKDQMRRASVSIMSNIAEGFGRKSNKDFSRFLDISRGSACELESLIFLATDLHLIPDEQSQGCLQQLSQLIGKIAGLANYLRSNDGPTSPKSADE